jgi:hypothetical protein
MQPGAAEGFAITRKLVNLELCVESSESCLCQWRTVVVAVIIILAGHSQQATDGTLWYRPVVRPRDVPYSRSQLYGTSLHHRITVPYSRSRRTAHLNPPVFLPSSGDSGNKNSGHKRLSCLH